ncbi:hypothetical protein OG496_38645 [Streptomyces sp. NBC_00988]|uniref:hypothetical protein n=1 Tax=Streptomyces sp. NBC_00988 TaxID=2903704 RepID=UPI00386F07DE|nr:hypothetical protein OG496_38645 [Streptomyces sp. NBC_00988]
MSRRTSTMSLGAALLLALGAAAVPADAAPHRPPGAERVSTAADGSQADGSSAEAAISADGRSVAFTSTAPSFGCARSFSCLRVKNLATGGVTAIDLGPGYAYSAPVLSADGSRVAFSAGTRFTAPYLYDRATGSATKLWPENPPGSNELGRVESLSPDGTHVAYTLGNRNGPDATRLLYVRDTATGTDELVSPAEEGDKNGASVSGDGKRVAYGIRTASEDDPADVYVKDRATGERTQVDKGLGAAYLVRVTADGRRVLLDAEGGLYVHDLRTGTSRRVAEGRPESVTADGRYAVVSGEDGTRVRDLRTGRKGAALPWDSQTGPDTLTANGLTVAFSSSASYLVPDDTNGERDVFVYSGGLGTHPAPIPYVTERISLTRDGQQRTTASHDPVIADDRNLSFTSDGSVFVNAPGGIGEVNDATQKPSSEGTPCTSGRMVGYVAPHATDGAPEVFIRNRSVGKLTGLASYQGVRFTWMGQPAMEPGCRWITYAATLPATSTDPAPQPRIYRFTFNGGADDLVSAPTGKAAANPSISYDGRYIAFEQGGAVHVRDLDTGTLEKAADKASAPSISDDGRKVAFQHGRDVYVRDLDARTTTRVAKAAEPSLSGDGARVAYTSGGSVYLLELATGKRQLMSADRWGGRSDLPALHPSVNDDGTVVAFESASADLVPGDTNGVSDVFVRQAS